MNRKLELFAAVCALAVTSLFWAPPSHAQMAEVKEKPRMYTYVAFWSIPRQQWGEQEKLIASEQKMMDKAVADGGLVAYGNDQTLIHQPEGSTHDTWFSAMSMAGLLNVLDQVYKAGIATSPVQIAATKHSDGMFVSRYYNWHPGTWKDVYSQVSMYRLKPDAADGSIDMLSKSLLVPLMEKQLADGTIHEYEIDTEAIHTEAPGAFWIEYIAANAEGLDKVSAAIRDTMKANPLGGPAFGSLVDYTAHRDFLSRTSATYK